MFRLAKPHFIKVDRLIAAKSESKPASAGLCWPFGWQARSLRTSLFASVGHLQLCDHVNPRILADITPSLCILAERQQLRAPPRGSAIFRARFLIYSL